MQTDKIESIQNLCNAIKMIDKIKHEYEFRSRKCFLNQDEVDEFVEQIKKEQENEK